MSAKRSPARSPMSGVDDEGDVFEITDFTTASDWERFIARLEEILHEWKLVNREPLLSALKDQYATGTWGEKAEEVSFADFKFTLSYMYLKSDGDDHASSGVDVSKKEEVEDIDEEHKTPTVFLDLMNFENDFPSRAHCLCRWYGLQEFLCLSPVGDKYTIDNESRAKLLLSSASVALSNSNCAVPIFVQLQSKWRKLYTGTSLVHGATIEFDMSHLRNFPSQYCHLAGLLDVFKSKLGCVYISMPPVSVAVRFTYILHDWVHAEWPQPPPDFTSFFDGEVGYGDIGILPFGASRDPISELHLSCTWPCLSEDMIVENNFYSDLDPLQAPQWTVRLQMTEDPQCLLSEFLHAFLELADRKESIEDVLRKFLSDSLTDKDRQGSEITHALQRLTEPVPSLPSISSIGSAVTSRMSHRNEKVPIPGPILDKIMSYLFPDAKIPTSHSTQKLSKTKSQESSASASSASVAAAAEGESSENEAEKITGVLSLLNKQLKSAPMDSLTHKLGLAFLAVTHSQDGVMAVAHLWQEFVLEMRFRWEHKSLLPGLERGAPNMGCCLLHQKLQMLNCCIERRIKRESAGFGYGSDSVNSYSNPSDSATNVSDGNVGNRNNTSANSVVKHGSFASSSEDDEFFECNGDDEGEKDNDDDDGGDDDKDDVEDSESLVSEEDEVCVSETSPAEVNPSSDSTVVPQEKSPLSPKKKHRIASLQKSRDDKSSCSSFDEQYQDSVTHRPEGRMVPMKNVLLLANEEQLYIPITQEPSPMTEDMLEEHAEVLANLGSSAEGSQIRARMQSACLVSDMESFKAANPGCLLEDFVRWYSPRDYITGAEDDEDDNNATENVNGECSPEKEKSRPAKRGHLSQRMQIPGNMWVEAWQSARPVPARRQKRLFDDTKEAEKVLHYLSSMKPSDVILHLMPSVVHAAIAKLAEESASSTAPNLKPVMDQIISKATKITRNFAGDRKKYADVLRMLDLSETLISRATSLRTKFSHGNPPTPSQEGKEAEIENFVTSLLQQSEVPVKGGACGPAGAIIHRLFTAMQKSNNLILDEEGDLDAIDTSLETSRNTSSGGLSLPPSERRPSSPSVPDFPPASAREYILRAMVPRPAPYSKVLPQRMFCVLVDGDNRLAGAFTSDSTFQ